MNISKVHEKNYSVSFNIDETFQIHEQSLKFMNIFDNYTFEIWNILKCMHIFLLNQLFQRIR